MILAIFPMGQILSDGLLEMQVQVLLQIQVVLMLLQVLIQLNLLQQMEMAVGIRLPNQ